MGLAEELPFAEEACVRLVAEALRGIGAEDGACWRFGSKRTISYAKDCPKLLVSTDYR